MGCQEEMEALLHYAGSWRVSEAVWTTFLAAQQFCIDHELLVGVLCVIILVVVLVRSCLRRGRPSRERSELEGGTH